MPAPHATELRERVVRAYETGTESFDVIAARFGVARRALQRWVKRKRETESVAPLPRGGGNPSPIDVEVLEAVLAEKADVTSYELTAEYNRRVEAKQRVHRSSVHRALQRAGYVFKKKSYAQPSKSAPMSKKSAASSSRG